MNYLSKFPLVIGAGWGVWCIFRTAFSASSDIMGEGQFVLMIALVPLVAVGWVHSALSRSYRSLSLLYSGWAAGICFGIGVAYWSVFGFTFLQTVLGIILAAAFFDGSLLLFRAIPWLREKAASNAN